MPLRAAANGGSALFDHVVAKRGETLGLVGDDFVGRHGTLCGMLGDRQCHVAGGLDRGRHLKQWADVSTGEPLDASRLGEDRPLKALTFELFQQSLLAAATGGQIDIVFHDSSLRFGSSKTFIAPGSPWYSRANQSGPSSSGARAVIRGST